MALNMNSFNIVGRLTDKPTTMTSGTGTVSTRFNVAVNRRGKDAGADFPRLLAFGNIATFLSQYGEKGMEVAVTGHISTGSYKKDNQTVYTTDLIVDNCSLGGSPKGTGAQPQQTAQSQAAQPQATQQNAGQQTPTGTGGVPEIDDML